MLLPKSQETNETQAHELFYWNPVLQTQTRQFY